MVQKSSSFILPILNINWGELNNNGYISTYMGDRLYTGDNSWGENLFIKIDKTSLSQNFESKLKSHKRYVTSYNVPDENTTMFVFSFEDQFKDQVVKPFLEGKYSKIDKSYVNMFFPKEVVSGLTRKPSMNWMILHKSDLIRQQWEDILETSLPDGAEVWSRPLITEEVHKYESQKQAA